MAVVPTPINTGTSVFITNFSISQDGQSIDVTVSTTTGNTITSVKFWTDLTFKDYNQAIDLSSLLTGGGNTYTFVITVEDVEVTTFFDGIFFAEFITTETSPSPCNSCNSELAVATKMLAAKLCLLEKVLNLDVCANHIQGCKCINTCEILTLDNLMDSMIIALEFGFYKEAIDLLKSIRKLCPECSECLDVSEINLSTGLGYGTLDNNFILS